MATISKVLARTAAATSSTTLYTVPSATTTVVTNIVICNPTTSAVTASITLDSVDLLGGVSLAANSTAFFDLKQVLDATKIIAGTASSTSVNFHISGVEIS
jgi:hypothetical protein